MPAPLGRGRGGLCAEGQFPAEAWGPGSDPTAPALATHFQHPPPSQAGVIDRESMRPAGQRATAEKRLHVGRPRSGCSGACAQSGVRSLRASLTVVLGCGGLWTRPLTRSSRDADARGLLRPAGHLGGLRPRPLPGLAPSVNAGFNCTSKCLPGSVSPQTQRGSTPESCELSSVLLGSPRRTPRRQPPRPGDRASPSGIPLRPPGPRAPRPPRAGPAGRRTRGLGTGGDSPVARGTWPVR